MSDIPDIPFLKQHHDQIEFEILTLRSLFSRQTELDHPLDEPHRVGFYHILFITHGAGRHIIDFRPYSYKAGSILFISRGQVHAFEVRPDVDGYLILFTESFLTRNLIHSDLLSVYRLYHYHLHRPIIQPEESKGNAFGHVISMMHREYGEADPFAKEEFLRLLLKLLLLQAERVKRSRVQPQQNADWLIAFGAFRKLLEKHHAETRSACDYARMLGVSYKHLNTLCKSIVGSTAKAFIDHFLILEIKRLLAVSNATIQEIGYQSGFDEPTNFNKFFKKHARQSPAQFRKKLTN